MFDITACLTLSLFLNLLVYDQNFFRSSSEVFCNFGNLRKLSKNVWKRVCGSRIIWRILESFRKVVGDLSKIVESVVIVNKTLHVACRYEISLLEFNVLVQRFSSTFTIELRTLVRSHLWGHRVKNSKFHIYPRPCMCILEETYVELILFNCILLSYSSCLFRQFPTRSKFTDQTQSLKIFAEWLSGFKEKMAQKLN